MKFQQHATGNRVNWARRRSTEKATQGTEIVDCVIPSSFHPPSCPPFAPPELPGFLTTMGALTPKQPALPTGRFRKRNPAHEHRSVSLRSPCFTSSNLPTIPPPTTCCRPRRQVLLQTSRLTTTRASDPSQHAEVPESVTWASPLASRLATDNRPNRVRHPADWPFSFSCSPPPLTRTQ